MSVFFFFFFFFKAVNKTKCKNKLSLFCDKAYFVRPQVTVTSGLCIYELNAGYSNAGLGKRAACKNVQERQAHIHGTQRCTLQ